MDAERRLLVLYVSCFVIGLVSSSSLAIAWLYWDPTLNSCISVNCGCILYSVVTFNTFVGGAGGLCRFAVFVQLPVLAWSAVAALYHAYRVYVPKKLTVKRRTVTFHEDGSRKNPIPTREPPKFYILAALGVVAAVLLFAQAWIITAGYFATCREYKKNVSSQLNANGNLAQLVFERLSCGTVYDFLDYLQPDPPLLAERYRRTYNIHSAYYLLVSILTSWLDCGLWVCIAAYNVILSCNKF
ncbi:uncharacterized protein LOC128983470 [Macrosteles quadrilineatus]|uniref:uncharacterized protein LOC128983470 n=1 Tax=Macrosteles quadrilineatus TaxID=74068 RepID=UPI0023E24D3E|nr:uncharacterized protein LOC128983470 [Macrosteles quadrilineatus]